MCFGSPGACFPIMSSPAPGLWKHSTPAGAYSFVPSHTWTHTAHPTLGADSQLPSLLQGVIEFSLCLLFAKLVSYTFLFWLPLYITNVGECWLEVRFQSLH